MCNPFSLEGKFLLVTGASSGIGRSIAVECSKLGASVIITGRDEVRLKETLSQMETPSNHQYIVSDLIDDAALNGLVAMIPQKIDGLVNCAGVSVTKTFKFMTKEDVDKIMNVNFRASLFLTQSLLKSKKINKGASIVFVSSVSGVYVSFVGGSIYSASKGAINGLTKSLALELATSSIRVNSVTPGMIETDFLNENSVVAEMKNEDMKNYPLKCYGKPEDVAYGVIYLLSDASKWVTGSNLLIDGGLTLK